MSWMNISECCARDGARYSCRVEGRKFKGTPARLEKLFVRWPLYFITFNASVRRQRLLDNAPCLAAFVGYARAGTERGVGVGSFVIMPDHVHLFGRLPHDIGLGRWIGGLKRSMGAVLLTSGIPRPRIPQSRKHGYWQPVFFDHVLRSDDSYEEKWEYVRMNPVRAGLVRHPDDWPYQGEIMPIRDA
jgi:putative transposase